VFIGDRAARCEDSGCDFCANFGVTINGTGRRWRNKSIMRGRQGAATETVKVTMARFEFLAALQADEKVKLGDPAHKL